MEVQKLEKGVLQYVCELFSLKNFCKLSVETKQDAYSTNTEFQIPRGIPLNTIVVK